MHSRFFHRTLHRGLALLFLVSSLFQLTVAFGSGHFDDSTLLPREIQEALDRFKLDAKKLSFVIQKVDDQTPLLAFNNDHPQNPASVIKLLTTLVALENLTPAHTWHTDLFTNGEIIGDTLNGDLLIRGGGDPYMSIERVWLLVRQLRRTGLREITGDLIIDQSLFDPIDEDPATFDERPHRAYNVVPAPLVTNFNVTNLYFTPDIDNGIVKLELDPPLPILAIENGLRLATGRCSGYQRGITLSASSHNVLRLDGNFPSKCKRYSMGRSVVGKNAYTAELFRQLWIQSGGDWLGSWQLGEADTDDNTLQRLLRFRSLSLAEITRSINKYSNNLMARMLFLSLGLEAYEAPANAEKSRQAVREWLNQHNIEMPELFVDNGAGSSRVTRISANSMVKLLLAGWQSRYMPEFVGSMALSGQDGTFRRRYRSGPLHGRIHAKTGRLDHVVALAGYYQSKRGDRYVFAILHNDKDVQRGSGQVVQDAILRWLSNTVE